jgi:predicted transcriptional regulator
MDKVTLSKGNQLQTRIEFLQKKSDELYNACRELIQEKTEDITEKQLTAFVKKLMETFDGSMALTDIVRVVTDDYKRKIEQCQKEFEEL